MEEVEKENNGFGFKLILGIISVFVVFFVPRFSLLSFNSGFSFFKASVIAVFFLLFWMSASRFLRHGKQKSSSSYEIDFE
ncbi:MAG: hypothetical protein V5A68_07665 [Candidatus Thermoplasmatota archaeon]